METTSPTSTIPIEFNGNAWEYFRIWIVNVCLTIISKTTLNFHICLAYI